MQETDLQVPDKLDIKLGSGNDNAYLVNVSVGRHLDISAGIGDDGGSGLGDADDGGGAGGDASASGDGGAAEDSGGQALGIGCPGGRSYKGRGNRAANETASRD